MNPIFKVGFTIFAGVAFTVAGVVYYGHEKRLIKKPLEYHSENAWRQECEAYYKSLHARISKLERKERDLYQVLECLGLSLETAGYI